LRYRHDWSGQCFGRSVTYSDGDAYCNRYSNCNGDCNGDCNGECNGDCNGNSNSNSNRNSHTHADGDANIDTVRRKMFSDTAASSDSSPSPVGRRFP
jgi:hypothetical protein